MKSRITTMLVLAGALSAFAPVSASAKTKDAAIGYWASQITVNSWNVLLERSESNSVFEGASRRAVLATMGAPAHRLSPDVWVYDDYQPDLTEARERGCDILVITFAQEKVATMKFVNPPAAEVIAAAARTARSDRYASNQ